MDLLVKLPNHSQVSIPSSVALSQLPSLRACSRDAVIWYTDLKCSIERLLLVESLLLAFGQCESLGAYIVSRFQIFSYLTVPPLCVVAEIP